MSERFNPYRHFVGSFIPNALMSYEGLSAGAKLLWARLAQYAGKDGACYPSQQRLSSDMGLSVRQVQRYLKELVDKGFLETEKPSYKDQIQGQTIRYHFLKHSVFRDDTCVAPGATDMSGGSRQMCRVPNDRCVVQRESGKEKKEENSFFPSPEESKKRCQELLTRLCS
jgi:DNA-binding transcriptional MocR family regulator